MKYSPTIIGVLIIGLWLSCNQADIDANLEITEIEISSQKIKDIISTVAHDRKTNIILMEIFNEDYSTTYELSEFYSTCQLNLGDPFGILVGEEWMNITPPLYRSKVDTIDVYIVSGAELLNWSPERYEYMIKELKGRIDRCVYSYDKAEDSFSVNAPRTSLIMPWKIKVLKESTVGGEQTKAIVYEPQREGFDDLNYKIDTVRIASNYRERYYSLESN